MMKMYVDNGCCCLIYCAENEREFNYEAGGQHGPERWGDIHSEWSACKSGSMQSPVDLLNERVEVVSHLGRLRRSYKPTNSTLKNRGHDIMVGVMKLPHCLFW